MRMASTGLIWSATRSRASRRDATRTRALRKSASPGPRVVAQYRASDVVSSISKFGANILNASSETKETQMVESFFTISVENKEHLEKILSAIKNVKHVQDARRVG
jgi:uncharacterized membrane protein YhiD involved in acid resistance